MRSGAATTCRPRRCGRKATQVYTHLDFQHLASVYDLVGEAERAIPLYEESADLLRRLGLEYELGTVVSNLGVCLMSQGRLDEAARLYEEAVELCRAARREEQLVI